MEIKMDKDKSKEKKALTEAQRKQAAQVLKVQHTAMIFETKKGAIQNLNADYNAIKKENGEVSFNQKFYWLQMGLKPIKTLWYMSKDECVATLNKTKWHKILFLDFEADPELKAFSKTRLEFSRQLFLVKDAVKDGLI